MKTKLFKSTPGKPLGIYGRQRIGKCLQRLKYKSSDLNLSKIPMHTWRCLPKSAKLITK